VVDLARLVRPEVVGGLAVLARLAVLAVPAVLLLPAVLVQLTLLALREVVVDLAVLPWQLAVLAHLAVPSQLVVLAELEVVALLARGYTNREIAEALVVTPSTIKIHVEHILSKLGASDRTQAAVRAIELGLLKR